MSESFRCPPEFTVDFRQAIARVLQGVYRELAGQFEPRAGRGPLWFGFSVFCHLGPALRDELVSFDGVSVEPEGGSFVVSIGPHRLRPNKIGRDASDPIASSFPRPSRRSVAMAAANWAQLALDLDRLDEPVRIAPLVEVDAADPTQWIIGHIGNGTDGLVAAYLCAPWLSDGEAIREWRGWIPIFNSVGALDEAPPPGPPDPSPVEIPEVEPQLRDEREKEAGAG